LQYTQQSIQVQLSTNLKMFTSVYFFIVKATFCL
jgi:hypothetical protein